MIQDSFRKGLKAGIPIPDAPDSLTRAVEDLPGEIPGLNKAEIRIYSAESGDLLITITAGWQEVDQ